MLLFIINELYLNTAPGKFSEEGASSCRNCSAGALFLHLSLQLMPFECGSLLAVSIFSPNSISFDIILCFVQATISRSRAKAAARLARLGAFQEQKDLWPARFASQESVRDVRQA